MKNANKYLCRKGHTLVEQRHLSIHSITETQHSPSFQIRSNHWVSGAARMNPKRPWPPTKQNL